MASPRMAPEGRGAIALAQLVPAPLQPDAPAGRQFRRRRQFPEHDGAVLDGRADHPETRMGPRSSRSRLSALARRAVKTRH
jgi:hypothetical protein